ncbi:hypothetical protein IAQ61_008314 [Plenodomus lingam]|nr:hypothetical protein IAQ61_008314 [Plenodomus lingam]
MSYLSILSSDIINKIASHLNEADRRSLEEAHYFPIGKPTPNPKSMDRFKTVKISLFKLSIDTFDKLTRNTTIASAIQHLTIGTETLDQFHHLITDEKITEQQREAYSALIAEEAASNANLATTLHNITTARLSSLKSISIEDRPAHHSLGSCKNEPLRNLAYYEIKHLTGIDLRWNGPYAALDTPSSVDLPAFPIASRVHAYTTVFTILQALPASEKHVNLDIVMRGYYGCEGVDAECRGFMPEVFDAGDSLFECAIGTQLRSMSVDMCGAESVWLSRLKTLVALRCGVVVRREGGEGEAAM